MIPLVACLLLGVPNPYVRLAAALPEGEWDATQRFLAALARDRRGEGLPPSPPFLVGATTPLAVERAVASRYAPILAGLRLTNEGAYDATEALTNEQYGRVKGLMKLLPHVARVRFADGDRHGAVSLLLDGLTMARRIRGTTTTGALLGFASEAIVLAAFADHLSQLPLAECERVRKFSEEILAEGVVVPGDAEPGVRARLADAPALWVVKEADPILPAFAKAQTQMRLLRLHMRLEAYRWRYLRPPDRLLDAAPEGETVDPLTQAPFRYERTDASYRLFSEGFRSLGPLGLRYRRDPDYVDPDAAPEAALRPERAAR